MEANIDAYIQYSGELASFMQKKAGYLLYSYHKMCFAVLPSTKAYVDQLDNNIAFSQRLLENDMLKSAETRLQAMKQTVADFGGSRPDLVAADKIVKFYVFWKEMNLQMAMTRLVAYSNTLKFHASSPVFGSPWFLAMTNVFVGIEVVAFHTAGLQDIRDGPLYEMLVIAAGATYAFLQRVFLHDPGHMPLGVLQMIRRMSELRGLEACVILRTNNVAHASAFVETIEAAADRWSLILGISNLDTDTAAYIEGTLPLAHDVAEDVMLYSQLLGRATQAGLRGREHIAVRKLIGDCLDRTVPVRVEAPTGVVATGWAAPLLLLSSCETEVVQWKSEEPVKHFVEWMMNTRAVIDTTVGAVIDGGAMNLLASATDCVETAKLWQIADAQSASVALPRFAAVAGNIVAALGDGDNMTRGRLGAALAAVRWVQRLARVIAKMGDYSRLPETIAQMTTTFINFYVRMADFPSILIMNPWIALRVCASLHALVTSTVLDDLEASAGTRPDMDPACMLMWHFSADLCHWGYAMAAEGDIHESEWKQCTSVYTSVIGGAAARLFAVDRVAEKTWKLLRAPPPKQKSSLILKDPGGRKRRPRALFRRLGAATQAFLKEELYPYPLLVGYRDSLGHSRKEGADEPMLYTQGAIVDFVRESMGPQSFGESPIIMHRQMPYFNISMAEIESSRANLANKQIRTQRFEPALWELLHSLDQEKTYKEWSMR